MKMFYIAHPTSKNWHVVLHGKKETNNEHEQANEIYKIESFTSIMINKHWDVLAMSYYIKGPN